MTGRALSLALASRGANLVVHRSRSANAAAPLVDALVNDAPAFPPWALDPAARDRPVRGPKANAWAPSVVTRPLALRAGRGEAVSLLDARLAGLDPVRAGGSHLGEAAR